MKRTFLQAKIHRAVVTDANLNYEGSVTVDSRLLQAAQLLPFQQVDIYNITRGTRLTTYLIPGEYGAGECCLNGAAAHLCDPGDRVIICAYAELDEHEIASHEPAVVFVGEDNTSFELKRKQPIPQAG